MRGHCGPDNGGVCARADEVRHSVCIMCLSLMRGAGEEKEGFRGLCFVAGGQVYGRDFPLDVRQWLVIAPIRVSLLRLRVCSGWAKNVWVVR